MKGGVAMMLAAFLRAKANGLEPAGDLVFSAMCDEENLSGYGAKWLVEEHPELFSDIRYAISEFGGFAHEFSGKRFYPIQVAEKQVCTLRATIRASGGHGSMPVRDGAMATLARMLEAADRQAPAGARHAGRRRHDRRLRRGERPARPRSRCASSSGPLLTDRVLDAIGDRGALLDSLLHNTASPTVIRTGSKFNVIPAEITVIIDARMLPGLEPATLAGEVQDLVGKDVELEVIHHDPGPADPDMALYPMLGEILEQADPGAKATPLLMPGVSDARFISRAGHPDIWLPADEPAGRLQLLGDGARRRRARAGRVRRLRHRRDLQGDRALRGLRVSDARPQTRWALTVPFNAVPLHDHRPLIERAEAAGYDDLWTGETSGPDGFTPLVLAAAWTKKMRLGTGVVNAFTRGPAVLAQHTAALQDASNGRFCLGIGSSSNVIVERWNEIPFEKPRTKVRETVEALRAVLAGERGPGGFKLDTPPETPPPIYIAALRERMLQLGGSIGDGTFVNFLPLSGLADRDRARSTRASARPASPKDRPTSSAASSAFPSRPRRACRSPSSCSPPTRRFPSTSSSSAGSAGAKRSTRWSTAWRDGDRAAAREAAPEDLIREIFIFGDGDAQKQRLAEFVEGGITTPVLTPICGPDDLPGMIDALAP